MKTYQLILLIASLCNAPGFARAAGGATGTGSGGNTIDVNGRPSLRDLVDETVCVWSAGVDTLAAQSYAPKIFASLDRLDPVYSALIRDEATHVTFCMTDGDLVQVKTEDQDGLTILTQDTKQVGIRLNDSIYIDRKLFNAMDERSRAYLVVHEIMHAFIPVSLNRQNSLFLNTDQDPGLREAIYSASVNYSSYPFPVIAQRNTKLRSFIKFISDNEMSPASLDSFLLQIRMNNVTWPSTREQLESLHQAETAADKLSDIKLSAGERAALMMPFLQLDQITRHWLVIADETSLKQADALWSQVSQASNPSGNCNRSTERAREIVNDWCFDVAADLALPSLDEWMVGVSGKRKYMSLPQDLFAVFAQMGDPSALPSVLANPEVLAAANQTWTNSDGEVENEKLFLMVVAKAAGHEASGQLESIRLANLRTLLSDPAINLTTSDVVDGKKHWYSSLNSAPQVKQIVSDALKARGLTVPKK